MTERLEEEGKSATAMILGITGGILGVIAGIMAILIGGAGMLLLGEPTGVAWLGATGIVFGLIGVAGGSMARTNPLPAGILMAIAGVGGFIVVSLFWILPGGLLLIGSLVAWNLKQGREEQAA